MIKGRLLGIEKRYNDLSMLLAKPEVLADQESYQRYAREHSALTGIVDAFRAMEKIDLEIEEYKGALSGKDEELRELAKEEIPALEARREELAKALKVMLLPKDPNYEKSVILEIRAGAGIAPGEIVAVETVILIDRHPISDIRVVDVLSSNP